MPDLLCLGGFAGGFWSSVLVGDLPKSAKDMSVVELTDFKIGSAAERY